jgi:glycopeptide antibiotics resistance protein
MVDILVLKSINTAEIFSSSREYHRVIELVPFNQIYGYLSGRLNVSPTTVLFNVFGNIAIFIPLGIYFALFRQDNRLSVNMLFVFLTSLFVEIIQFALGLGISDIDDIILNCLGGFIGILIYKGLARLLKSREMVRSVVTVFSAIAGLPVFVITVLLYVFN